MNRLSIAWFWLGVALSAFLAVSIFGLIVTRTAASEATDNAGDFAAALDLTPLDRAAVYHEGRLKSFDAFAMEVLSAMAGRRKLMGQPQDFTYLDMIFRPERYQTAQVIHVKNKSMRAQLAAALAADGTMDENRRDRFIRDGMISELELSHPRSAELIERWARDVVRTAKHAEAIMSARELKDPQVLLGLLRLVPPPSGRADQPWVSVLRLWSPAEGFEAIDAPDLAAMDQALLTQLRASIGELASAWRAQDPARVNASIAELAGAMPRVAPAVYPDQGRMLLQSWYFRSLNMTWVWIIYLAAGAMLLMSVVYRWERARLIGMGVFTVAFTLHTIALLWRWYVAGRWPNSNMFEAVTTSVWLGTLAVIVLEWAARRTPMRNLFAIGGAGASMCALMAAHYVPQLNASINNMMPVLHDLWLYIHTNVIIASYALIAMASVTALLYLAHRALGGGAEYARVGGAATLMDITDAAMHDGASLTRRHRGMGEILDGATMVLLELSFVMLWAGIVMGAIWADHSWGRPWGWDPKEVFALNTFLIFLILVHVRLKARDKGLWTAILALVGCGVMLFNWIVINFVISGLHSYA